MVRKMIYLLMITLLVLLAMPVQASGENAYTLGLSLPTDKSEFFDAVNNGAVLAAEEIGADLVVLTSEDYDLETELANVQELIEQGVDALLLSPADPVESVAAIEAANEAEVPVFVIGDVILDKESEVEIAGRIVANAESVGEMAGEALCGALEGTGTVLELMKGEEANAGFNAYLAENCADINVVALDVTGLEFNDAVAAISEALGQAEADAIFAPDDPTTQSAASAKGLYRANPNLVVVGAGMQEDTFLALEGELLLSMIIADPVALGQSSVETSLAYLSGETITASLDAALMVVDFDSIEITRCFGVPAYLCK